MIGIETLLILLAASILIGIIGSMLGIGGGIFLIPIMTLGLDIDIKVAAATSLVTIIVTSSTSASGYLKDGFVNVGLGMFLEMFTVTGAIIGAVLVVYLRPDIIEAIFGIVLVYAAFYMRFSRDVECRSIAQGSSAKRSRFTGRFYDRRADQILEYDVNHLPRGAGASFVAGNLSGLIGVGGGIVMVPAMNLWMGVPMKAATATSTLILGVTAVASALVYLSNGLMAPVITAAAAIGIFIGATIGTRAMPKITGGALRAAFSVTIIVIAILMFLRAGGLF
jgi:hypothetical protein